MTKNSTTSVQKRRSRATVQPMKLSRAASAFVSNRSTWKISRRRKTAISSGPTPSKSAMTGAETVQLKSRMWRITDAVGHTEEVRGPGVVGQTPVIEPGKSFNYTSGCPLKTPQGIMVGSYQMTDEAGKLFDVAIPAFSLDSPYTRRSMN